MKLVAGSSVEYLQSKHEALKKKYEIDLDTHFHANDQWVYENFFIISNHLGNAN
jgi:hypothetical protein